MRMFGENDTSVFDTLDHHKHRMRREPWNPYFSKASVSRLQPLLIQNCVNKICDRLAEHQAAGKTVIMTHAYACLTVDVISEYAFPQGYGFLNRRPNFEFQNAHYDSYIALSKISHLLKQFGWLFPVLNAMPLWITKRTSPETYLVIKEQHAMLAHAQQVKAQLDDSHSKDYKEVTGRPSMFEAFMTSPSLPQQEKTPERLKGEAIVTIGAGTLTSTHALKHATYHILSNPAILDRLMSELNSAIPNPISNPPDLKTLESIDYLMAILYETLRVFNGVVHRLQRILPDRVTVYGKGTEREVVIPPGTPVSMTSLHVHEDAGPFPKPYEFNPERWLPLRTNGVRLQRYLVPFGKGSRQCESPLSLSFSVFAFWKSYVPPWLYANVDLGAGVGMELGKAEILTALANVFLRFGRSMRLVDAVRERDIDCKHDFFNPLPSKGNNGLVVAFDKA